MDTKLNGKVAIITGSGQGIGKAISVALAKEGCSIVLCDIMEDLIISTAQEIKSTTGMEVISVKADISKYTEAENLVKNTVDRFSKVDILVNNAGITRDNLILRMTETEWDEVINVNLKGTFNCIKAVSRYMVKQRSGRIINISSVVGLMGNAGQSNYSASKGGIISLTKTCAREFASRGILVNAIAPGFIRTRMTDVLSEEQKQKMLEQIPLKKLGEIEDIANAVVFLCSEQSSYITGQVLSVNGGMYM